MIGSPHDIPKVITGKEFLLLCVKQVEADFQALDLVHGEAGLLVDLVEVNVGVRIRTLVGHLRWLGFAVQVGRQGKES